MNDLVRVHTPGHPGEVWSIPPMAAVVGALFQAPAAQDQRDEYEPPDLIRDTQRGIAAAIVAIRSHEWELQHQCSPTLFGDAEACLGECRAEACDAIANAGRRAADLAAAIPYLRLSAGDAAAVRLAAFTVCDLEHRPLGAAAAYLERLEGAQAVLARVHDARASQRSLWDGRRQQPGQPICPVRLQGVGQKGLINGIAAGPPLTGPECRALGRLIEAHRKGRPGLTKKELGETDRAVLDALRKKDPAWHAVLRFPGKRGPANRPGYYGFAAT